MHWCFTMRMKPTSAYENMWLYYIIIVENLLHPQWGLQTQHHDATCKVIQHTKHMNTYLLTPWSRVLLEKLTGFQLVKKFPAFYGTRRFITAFTSARHVSLSWASSIQSASTHPTFWRSIILLSSHLLLGPPRGLFPSDFTSKTL